MNAAAKTKFGLHYTPVQLANDWGFSADFVRDLFKDEPGVIVIERPERMKKRGYTSLRIPVQVADRVYKRLTTR
jgi:hypothetical protein